MTQTLTADEAIALLRNNPTDYATKDQLHALAAQVDADSSGRLTVLYSGPATKGVWSTDVINAMRAAGEDVRVINGSHASDFLNSRDFFHAVARAHDLDDPEPLVRSQYRGPASDWLYHPTEGPWADASARFADATKGEVRAIVGDAQPSRVFGAVEVPHILANQNVTTVEGIPREVLAARQSSHGTQAAFEMIVARARDNVGQLHVAVNYAGAPLRGDDSALLMDSRSYFAGTQIEGKTPRFTTVTRPLADSMNPPTEYVQAGQRHLEDWHAQLAREARAAEAARGAPIRRMGVAAGLGVAASAYDAVQTGQRVGTLLAQDNPLAAQSALTHYAARGTGGWIGGAATGLAVGWETGPGVIAFVAVGAMAGSHVGENAAQWWDDRKIYSQTDGNGVDWRFNGQQWLRQEQGDLQDDGIDAPAQQSFSALPDKARELNYLASNAATALSLGKLEAPRDPYDLPANERDSRSLAEANWKYDADSGAWHREVVIARTDRGHPLTRPETASPERAVELDRAAEQVIRENLASGPAPVAARYEIAYRANGWERLGPMPEAVHAALASSDRLMASDKELYQRAEDGSWRRESGEMAQGNIPRELDGIRAQLQPALAQHAEQVAAIPSWQAPTREQLDRTNLLTAYAAVGVAPNPERLNAALEAVRRTRDGQGIDAATTSLHLERGQSGRFDVHSPIAHLRRDGDGVVRVGAVTSAQEVELALVDLRSRPAQLPDALDLRIAALSPQQREAQEQVVREANRQGLSHDEVRQVAQQAAAIDASPAVGAATVPPIRDPELVRGAVQEPRAPPQSAETVSTVAMVPPSAAIEINNGERKPEPIAESAKHEAVATQPPRPDGSSPVAEAAPPPVAKDIPAPVEGDDTLKPGDQGQQVELLQYRLQRVGYRAPDDMPLPQHGRFDAATEHAVRQFQRDQGLPDSGRVDPDTLQALSVAQHVRIELTKAAEQDAPAAQSRRASLLPPTPTADSIEDAIKRLDTYPLPDIAPTQPLATQAPAAPAALQPIADQVPKTSLADANIAARVDPHVLLPREPHSIADEPKVATDVQVAPAKATPSSAREQPATDVSRLSPEDQAMFAKIRGQAPDNVPDATVAHAMLEAKRNGIPDAERVGQVGVVGGTLWVGSVTPGFMAGVSATAPAPPMQDTVREAQAFNQQRDQQLAQEAMQRSQDDPSQGPKR